MAPVVLIHSSGRSGSNILLDSLDLSPYTHCRNEPEYDSSPLRTKITAYHFQEVDRRMAAHWDEVVRWMSCRWATKDRHHPQAAHKDFYRPLWARLGITKFLIEKNRTRRALSVLYPPFRGEEFTLPSGLLSPGWLEETTQVFKVNTSLERQIPWILKHRPEVKHLFLIRHPLGFAQSILRRLYTPGSEEMYHDRNRKSIRTGLEFARKLGFDLPDVDVDSLSLYESLIWHWLMFNEITYRACLNHPSVLTIVYEALLAEPDRYLKLAFDHCGLEWTPQIDQSIRDTYQSSAHLALSYRDAIDKSQQEITQQILNQAMIRDLWPDELWERLAELTERQEAEAPSYSPY
jgi:hypothetical protein